LDEKLKIYPQIDTEALSDRSKALPGLQTGGLGQTQDLLYFAKGVWKLKSSDLKTNSADSHHPE